MNNCNNDMNSKYSVLMSVYAKEKPENLCEAIESVFRQTKKTDDFVLVCDGPLTDELDEVISRYSERLSVVRLPQNVGLGRALNEGIKYCKYNLVARMDSDDISRPDRCQKQLSVFRKNPQVSITSGIVEEFTESIDKVYSKRVPPEKHKQILKFAKNRNPFNHPCVMYKKYDVLAVGGYQDFYLLEDYYLWIRMLLNGAIGYNIQEPLLWMRAGDDLYKRRSGWMYAKSQCKLFMYMREKEFISDFECAGACILRICSSIAPNWLRKAVFYLFLRKS